MAGLTCPEPLQFCVLLPLGCSVGQAELSALADYSSPSDDSPNDSPESSVPCVLCSGLQWGQEEVGALPELRKELHRRMWEWQCVPPPTRSKLQARLEKETLLQGERASEGQGLGLAPLLLGRALSFWDSPCAVRSLGWCCCLYVEKVNLSWKGRGCCFNLRWVGSCASFAPSLSSSPTESISKVLPRCLPTCLPACPQGARSSMSPPAVPALPLSV